MALWGHLLHLCLHMGSAHVLPGPSVGTIVIMASIVMVGWSYLVMKVAVNQVVSFETGLMIVVTIDRPCPWIMHAYVGVRAGVLCWCTSEW